jgi:bifunctional UDP-N-acetylglucosamine pyrophosphorylase/glucosamine-1-phosphate N-acetyltransferase
VQAIVEHKAATPGQLAVREINSGIYCFDAELFWRHLDRIRPDNPAREYYLTDVIAVLRSTGHRVAAAIATDPGETHGVNDRWQLALAERELRARTNRRWLLAGVTMLDPRQTFVDVTVQLGRDVTLYPGTLLQGRTVVGDGCDIGPDTRLVDCVVGAAAVVENSVCRDAEIGARAHVGPYAVLPPGTVVASDERTGAFYTGAADGGDDGSSPPTLD